MEPTTNDNQGSAIPCTPNQAETTTRPAPRELTLTATIAGQGFTGITVAMTGSADEPDRLARDLTDVLRTLERSDDMARAVTARTAARYTLDKRAVEVQQADAIAARAAAGE